MRFQIVARVGAAGGLLSLKDDPRWSGVLHFGMVLAAAVLRHPK